MLTRLGIQNFKGIASCDFEEKDLSRINLLIGKNDSGKSSIMEAAYYMFKELCGSSQLYATMSRRTDVSYGVSEIWFKYRIELPIVVSASFESVKFEWKIELTQEGYVNSLLSQKVRTPSGDGYVEVRKAAYSGGDFSFSSSSGNTNALQAEDELKKTITAYATGTSFIDCTIKSKTREIERILARFKIDGKERRFGEVLNDVYGKGKEWEFMPQLERPEEKRLAIREAGHLRYFSDFGDGLRCCVGVLGTAMSLRNTAIFIEEIESHQHSGSLSKLIRHLVTISRENNLQVFLSTHSLDTWESLSRGVYVEDPEKQKEEFRCLLIERDPETGKVTVESTDDLQKITKALK